MAKPLEITGLAANSYYEFYVQSVCSQDLQSPWTGPEPFSTFPKQLNATIFIAGPYDSIMDQMQVNLNTLNLVPLEQPYQGEPWNYAGDEQVSEIPAGAVDWVLLEWRTATSPALADSSTYIWRKAGFLMNNGSLRDLDGVSLPWIGNPQLAGSLYIVVRHRNHLEVMSNLGATLQGDIYSFNFSTHMTRVYGGSIGYRKLDSNPPRYGMVSGDGNADGQISTGQDLNSVWNSQAGLEGYLPGDYDMNGQTQNQDKNDFLVPNFGKYSPVP